MSLEDDLKSKPILVTGGAGFVGSHLVEALLLQGRQVVLVDALNSETSSRDEKLGNIELLQRTADSTAGSRLAQYECDIREQDRVVEILRDEKPIACIHAAARVRDRRSVECPGDFLEHNCTGTFTLLEAIKGASTVEHLVYLSSRSAYGEKAKQDAHAAVGEGHPLRPINMYGASKVAAEQVCCVYHQLYGLTVNVCRLFPVYGPRGRVDMFPRRLLEKISAEAPVEVYGDVHSTRDWLFIDDAVDGILRALTRPMGYEVVNLGTGKGTTLAELIAAAEEVVGRKANISRVARPAGDARFVGVADITRAKQLLQWEPQTELRAGLARTFAEMRS